MVNKGIRLISFCIGLFLCLCQPAFAKDIYVDSKLIIHSNETIREGTEVLVPLEKFLLSLPVEFKRDEPNSSIIIKNPDNFLKIYFDKKDAYFNGKYITLTTAPRFKDYYGYLVPAISISKLLYGEVEVDNQRVSIKTKMSPSILGNNDIRWVYFSNSPISKPPIIDKQWNLIIPDGNKLTWISPLGEKIKEVEVGQANNDIEAREMLSTPVQDIKGGLVVTASPTQMGNNLARRLYRLNSDGTTKWFFGEYEPVTSLGKEIQSRVSIDGHDNIYLCLNKRLYAVNTDGQTRWIVQENESIMSNPILVKNMSGDDIVAIVSGIKGPRLQAYKVSDGKRQWINTEPSGELVGEVTTDSLGRIYFSTNSLAPNHNEKAFIWVVKGENGQLLQKIQSDEEFITGVSINNNEKAYLTTNHLVKLDQQNNIAWKKEVLASPLTPVMKSGTITIVEEKSWIAVYDASGNLKKKVNLIDNIVFVASGPGETIVAGTSTGKIYCINL